MLLKLFVDEVGFFGVVEGLFVRVLFRLLSFVVVFL